MTDATAPDPPPPAGEARLGYAQALGELERILAELEASDVDVDVLADRVARANELIVLCRERIGAARVRIDAVIADLDATDQPGV